MRDGDMEVGVLCGAMRAGPTDKIFEQRLEGRKGGNPVDILGKDIPGRGRVGIKYRNNELAWCLRKNKEASGAEAEGVGRARKQRE